MKKIFALIAVVAMCYCTPSSAQVAVKSLASAVGGATTSITCVSTTPNYLYIQADNAYTTAIFQPVVTRVSTAIGGTIFLQGSVDNSNWHTATYVAGDTVTVANSATQALKIYVSPVYGLPFKYYRLKCTGASSDTMTVTAKFCGR